MFSTIVFYDILPTMLKKFLMKSALRMKGVSKDQAEEIANKLDKNPELANALKALDANKEVKTLFENIQKDIEEKTKGGLDPMMAQMSVMMKYKSEIQKHQEALMPLMKLIQK